MSYVRLDHEQDKPRTARDWTVAWQRLPPITETVGDVRTSIMAFCERKGIAFDALAELGTRYAVRRDVPCFAFAGTNGNGKVTAIKYRPINGSSHECFAEAPSVWLRPIVIGNRASLDWLIVEGETDGARLYGLAGDCCSIVVLPTGARAFRPEWAGLIPRGATVALCHDADEDGDSGAEKAARIIGGRTVRVRPPIEGTDWCDFEGDREAFLKLAKPVPRRRVVPYPEFATRRFATAEPLLGGPGKILLAIGSLLMVYGQDGCGKSTWTIDGVVHLAAGADWLGIPVPRPVRVCIIENEGPPSLYQQKLGDKIAGWEGPDPTPNLFVHVDPWGEFSFADADARAALCDYCDEHAIELVAANPTLGLGVGTSGKPDETRQFVDWLTECGLWTTRAFWLLHHENKAGQISGDWGRHPDTKALLQRDGNKPRTKLDWAKTRWAALEQSEKAVMLEWAVETQGYTVTELSTTVASDDELDERINAYLTEHPASSTRTVEANVTGNQARIRARLDAKFDCVKGPRNSILWFPQSTASTSAEDAGTQWSENPDE